MLYILTSIAMYHIAWWIAKEITYRTVKNITQRMITAA